MAFEASWDSALPDIAANAFREQSETWRKMLAGVSELRDLRQSDLEIGTSPKDVVYRDGHMALLHYVPTRPVAELAPPLLIVYSLVNRYDMIDLQPDRSIVRRLLDRGADLYVIDWGYPTPSDRWTTVEDHVESIGDCADVIRERHGLDDLDLLGICQGGFFALCYAALHPELVRNLITMIVPVDFDLDQTLMAKLARHTDVDRMVDALGNVPGRLIAQQFLMRSPFAQHVQKYADLVHLFEDRDGLLTFLRMEKWINDSPDHPGETFRSWIKDCYQQNRLIKGSYMLGDRVVDLRNVTMPILNLYGERDDIVEPASSLALGRYVGSDDVTVRSFPVGHIGMYVSGKTQQQLPATIVAWLEARP
ncbi:MAG: class III poly(R)-hydroxyalkanoic acid synthase subunit PhaC [Vulcanimicrobiaceae bacterium]